MPYSNLEAAPDIKSLTLAALEAGAVLVKSDRKEYLSVAREGDTIRVSNPWRQGSAAFDIAADREINTAAYWKQNGKTFLSRSVPIGLLIENEFELPFFDLNVPVTRSGLADYDSRN